MSSEDKCEYCGKIFLSGQDKCTHCGAPRIKITREEVKETIDEIEVPEEEVPEIDRDVVPYVPSGHDYSESSFAVKVILVPLFALFSLVVMFILIPIFSQMAPSNQSGAFGEMQNTLANFAPVYAIGLAIGIIAMFFSLMSWFSGKT